MKHRTFAFDIFSFGHIVYEVWTGKRPYSNIKDLDMKEYLVRNEVTLLDNLKILQETDEYFKNIVLP